MSLKLGIMRGGLSVTAGSSGGVSAPTFVDATSQSQGTTSVSMTANAAREAGDLLVAGIASRADALGTPTAPTGWTAIGAGSAEFGQAKMSAYLRVADGTAADNFEQLSAYTTANSAQMLIYRGVDNATPLDVAAVYSGLPVVGKTHSITGLTTVSNNAMIVNLLTIRDDNEDPTATNSSLTLSKRFNTTTTFGGGCAITGWDGVKASAGLVSDTVATWTVQDETAAAVMIALRGG